MPLHCPCTRCLVPCFDCAETLLQVPRLSSPLDCLLFATALVDLTARGHPARILPPCRYSMDRGSLLVAVEHPDSTPRLLSLQEGYALMVGV